MCATVDAEKSPNARHHRTGTILIKEGTPLPEVLRFESEPCAPGWRLVKNLDGYGLGRKSTKRAGPSPGGLVKSERPSSVLTNKRRSAGTILANLESAEFNSLEIMRVA